MNIFVDLDDTLADYTSAYEQGALNYPQAEFGFFAGLKPLYGGIGYLKYLQSKSNINVWILTAPSTKNLLCYSEKAVWVKKYLGEEFLERLIISPDKTLIKGDILIDDKPWDFEGEQILFGSKDFPDWAAVATYLNKELR
jgi:5'-nucleotidase